MKQELLRQIRLFYSTSMQSQNNTRLTWLDMAKGVAIILVIMGHRGFITKPTQVWLSSFHLPLFFLASGFLMATKKEHLCSPKTFIIRKIRTLLIPYFAFSLASILLQLVLSGIRSSLDLSVLYQQLIYTVTLQGYSVLWFFPVLFFAELFFFGLCKKWSYPILTAVTSVIAVLAYLQYHQGMAMAAPGLISMGDGFLKMLVKICIATAFLSYGACLQKLLSVKNPDFAPTTGGRRYGELGAGLLCGCLNFLIRNSYEPFDLNNLALHSIALYLLLGFTGSTAVICLCKNSVNIPPLTFFGRNSLILLCTHMNFYVLYMGTICYMALPDIILINELFTSNLLTLLFTLLLEVPVILFINTFTPFMLGQKYHWNS